ncbi:hypothetical protein DPMN_085173 [Dreissena polymorpha]|uniref:Uncharacterized protein n=1 Tax=Dreissena polymorpha TaxID=45954 RepID=A0A9D3YFY0_DREPO|nr:hypothetical protein DPMN_085173 [Dreissena polymorpha]
MISHKLIYVDDIIRFDDNSTYLCETPRSCRKCTAETSCRKKARALESGSRPSFWLLIKVRRSPPAAYSKTRQYSVVAWKPEFAEQFQRGYDLDFESMLIHKLTDAVYDSHNQIAK